jgi:predicted AAA+ superfamily ATPase
VQFWPARTERFTPGVDTREQPCTFRYSFGLDELPAEPGIILIRGPRQFGKSTWLELELRRTLEGYGPGSAYFLNGDEITDADELEARLLDLLPLFASDVGVRRIFIDEVSAVSTGSGL